GRQKRALSSETPADSRVTVPGIWQVRYSTATGGQMNFGAMVPSASADPSFPTCGLTLAPLRDFVKRDDNMFAQFYALSGEIIDAGVPSGIAVEMTAPGAAEPLCWNEGQL